MASPEDELAGSLSILNELQDQGKMVPRAADTTRNHWESLL